MASQVADGVYTLESVDATCGRAAIHYEDFPREFLWWALARWLVSSGDEDSCMIP